MQTIAERLGRLPRSIRQTAGGAIWFHAVSVGEVLASVEVIRCLREVAPETPIFVSTTTLAGRELAEQRLKALTEGIFYAPLDFVFAVREVLRRIRPQVLVVLETEIWPNLYREAKRAGCGLVVLNGRISDRAFPRYRQWRWWFHAPLSRPDAILVQSDVMKTRFIAAGAPAGRVSIMGNLKFDIRPARPPAEVVDWLAALPPHQTWIAASTMPPDEEETVIEAFQYLAPNHPGLLLILAPRRPDRFDLAAGLLSARGIRTVRRSRLQPLELPGVLLLDTIGELSGLFDSADVVFVGGSIVSWGGHNILEPAVFSKPIVVGRHMMNFQEMADLFKARRALVEVGSAGDLAPTIERLLGDPEERRVLGERARLCAEAERGAVARAVEAITRNYSSALPCFRGRLDWTLWPAARLWHAGSTIKRHWQTAGQRRLPVLVVSVGNLSMGGTGKTPLVAWLAREFDAAVLTRGYGRRSNGILLFAPGDQPPIAETGDEAQIFLDRSHVAIGPDRHAAGTRALERFPIRRFVLDDGFQHWRLGRDADIVLIDALDPLGGGDVFPRGRLREPIDALNRAGAFVITRTQPFGHQGLERFLRDRNARAPIFAARLEPVSWISCIDGRRLPLGYFPPCDAVAFCGLAQPESFWRTLRGAGLGAVERIAFPDHHDYTRDDLQGLLSRAPVGLTTQKDAVKIPEPFRDRVFWLEVRLRVEPEGAFRKWLEEIFAARARTPV